MLETLEGSERSRAQKVGLILGPILAVGCLFLDLDPTRPEVSRMAAVAALMATWWITEAIPLAATALLPLVLFPVLGIQSGRETAPVYVNSTIFLFVGGFLIAIAMETWNLHRRIALWIILAIGGGPPRIVLGFMLASAFLSMWISNTATAIMMVPIGLAIVTKMEEDLGEEALHDFSVSLMLGIAYACSLGGVATLVGTPPNLSFSRIFQITFPEAEPIAFGQWFLMGLPLATVMLVTVWLLLTRLFFRTSEDLAVDRSILRNEKRKLGALGVEERWVLLVFTLTAVLWVFRRDLELGPLVIPGWSRLVPFAGLVDDGTVAMAMALLLFVIPTGAATGKSATILSGDAIRKLPWNIVLLFGGGFALARGFQVSGLSEFVGGKFAGLAGMPPLVTVLAVCFVLTFLTELTSNTATTEMVLPILAAVAVAMGVHPLLLMVPATLSASHAFMMPVATPPNAIVFGSGRIRIPEMARVGLVINLIGIVVVSCLFYFLGSRLLGIDPSVFPEWAAAASPVVGE